MGLKPTIVFLGSGPVAAASLESLIKNFQIEAVITKAVPAHHKGTAPVEELAKQARLPIVLANTRSELDTIFQTHSFSSRVGVIVDYGVIVSQDVIDSFPLGIINSHFSLLPEWRGADPITFAILSGQTKTGVSLMLIEPSLDTGKLIAQKSLPIAPDETTQSLTAKLVDLSNDLLNSFLPRYSEGLVKPRQQPHQDRATYSRKLTKQDSILDFSKPAAQLEREVRAFIGWPKSRTQLLEKDIIVTRAHVADAPSERLEIRCGDGKYLVIDELIGPSGKIMSGQAFLNGYRRA